MTVSDRERFLAVSGSGPLLRADAVVVLCGEDGAKRLDMACGLLAQGGAQTLVLTGGLDNPPYLIGADRMRSVAIGKGVNPSRIVCDPTAMNTREQAVNIVQMAVDKGWHRLLLVASAYHSPRAYLTFVKALEDAGQSESIHIVNVPASQAPWFQPPEGMTRDRADLLNDELRKVTEYGKSGHVATWADGLAYWKHWEGRP